MAYVIVAVIVVLIIAGFVVFMVTNAAQKGDPVAGGDRPPGIGPDDETPLGDTTEHADERTASPRLVGRHETDDPDEAAHRVRPGEAEGEQQAHFEPERPRREP